MRSRRVASLMAGIALVASGAAGCGSSEDDSSPGTATAAEPAGASGGLVAEAKKNVEANYAGTDRALPASSPKPATGKSVWIITCSANAEGCSAPAAGAAEAAKLLGWTTKTVDGKLDPATFNASVRAAVAAKADAVMLVSVDCGLTKASLQAAKKAGVKVASLYAQDCDDRYAGGGAPLFDSTLGYAEGTTYTDWLDGPYSQSIADYVIAKSDGKAKVIAMQEDDVSTVRHIGVGFVARMKRCGGCEVTTVPFTGADFLNGKLAAKTQTALTQHPDATFVFAPYDASVSLGIGAGVKASGRDKQITLVGGEGLTPNIAMIKSGTGQDFAAGAPARWAGWAAIDELNRAFAGAPPVDEGLGLQSIDKDHNIPTKTTFYDGNAKSDYEANFRKIWGLGS